MDVRLVNLGIAEDLLNRVRSTTNDILAEGFSRTGTSEGSEVIHSKRESISSDVLGAEKRVRVARSQAVRETTNSMRV